MPPSYLSEQCTLMGFQLNQGLTFLIKMLLLLFVCCCLFFFWGGGVTLAAFILLLSES